MNVWEVAKNIYNMSLRIIHLINIFQTTCMCEVLCSQHWKYSGGQDVIPTRGFSYSKKIVKVNK